jgi:uncharacterized protein
MTSSNPRQLIDWHTHCYLPEHRGEAERATMKAYGVIGGTAWPENHRRNIEEGGVDKFVLVGVPRRPGHVVPNEFVAEYVARFPGRAVGLAAVHPHDPTAAKEFEHSIRELGLKGLKLSPVYQGFDPWSPEVWRLYEMADDFKVPVMFHVGGVYDPSGHLEWGNPLLLDRIGRSFPELKMIVAHFGQPMMEETVILMRKNRNVFTDLSARFHRKWQLYHGLQVAIEYKVTDRILFGSDFPVMTTHESVTAFKQINDWGEGITLPRIPDELIDDIVYRRPFSLMGWT